MNTHTLALHCFTLAEVQGLTLTPVLPALLTHFTTDTLGTALTSIVRYQLVRQLTM